MRFSVSRVFSVALCVLVLASCSPYEKVLKSNDVNFKLAKANEYYDNKKFIQANELYRSLIPVLKGTKNYEPLYYKYAWSFYFQKDYLDAAYHFKNFTDFFPSSKDADECEYMHAVCLYKLAPKSSLDQTNTIKAMEALQQYINTHPSSTRITEANGYMAESRGKLEDKEATAAKMYYNIGQYKAAGIAYGNTMREYPESPNSDYYQYMIIRSDYLYARQSVDTKQAERYASAISAYDDMKSLFPNSPLLKNGEEYSTQAANNIKNINHKNGQ